MRKQRKHFLDTKREKDVLVGKNVGVTSSLKSAEMLTHYNDMAIGDCLNIGMVNSDAKQSRLLRKLYLDNKRQKTLSNSQIQHVSPNTDAVIVSLNFNVAKKDTMNSKSKQRRKFTNNSFNRLNPIGSSAQQLDDAQHINMYSSVSKDYLDHVQLPDIKEPPQAYKSLYDGLDPKSKFFLKNIRRYNSMFSFTSMGGKIDSSINRGNAPYVFKLSGQNYHSFGSLLPTDGSKPKFSQLYIYTILTMSDTNKASTSTSQDIDFEIIQHLKNILDSNNVLVQAYRTVRDCFKEKPNLDLKLRLIGNRQKDGRTYNLPTASEVAALIVGDIGDSLENRDIVVLTKEGYLKHISELHPSYLALQYPLLFLYGEDCYRVDIPHRSVDSSTSSNNKKCTMREFFAYRIQDRIGVFSTILNSRRLYQQFLVDGYTMIEAERLNYIRNQQKELRCESFEKLRNLRNSGTTDVSKVGKRVILPSSFTGGARYMTQNYLDAMSICKWYGYPDLFLTFTCNPKRPEVKRFLKETDLNAEDRPDILCRLFKIKLDSLIKDLKEKSLLGKVLAVVYIVEFQKRGLPHAHVCLFLHADHKFPSVAHVDPIICAEIPDKNEDPELYTLVSDFMIHGPCGAYNINCSCMVDKKCSKNFPKQFHDHTSIDESGFPLYRRRDCGSFVVKSDVKLDNRHVVPYNKTLLKKYQAHINIEWCNQTDSIKYLFKYINKGPDRVTVSVVEGDQQDVQELAVDEIKNYYDCRYVYACEASWRIFSYDVHYRYPSVIRLPFHLPNQQQFIYGPNEYIDNVLNKPSVSFTKFLSWMEYNECNEDGRNLTYVEFPTRFVWKSEQRCSAPRKQGFSLGRIHAISPSAGEASYAAGLLDDDMEYVEGIQEASHAGSGHYLRCLFATMLTSNSLSRPDYVWDKTWEILSDGILYKQRRILKSPDLFLNEDQIKNLTLNEIEKILVRNNHSLRDYKTLPYPDYDSISSSNNRLITEEMDYDRHHLQIEFDNLFIALTDEQKTVYNEIINAVGDNQGGVFFVYGYGGTGKTFLWKTLSASLRAQGKIVLNVASSGIASLLLTGDSDVANLLKKTSLIIWDEAPMIHMHGFEALDRTLRDILLHDDSNNSSMPFGGKAIVFGGDFRQVLPVIQSGTRQDIVNASLSSYIWDYCKVLRLTKNMRLTVGSEAHKTEQTKIFAQWLLDLGEGNIGGSNDDDAIIEIPNDLLILDSADPISDLIDFERAILAPTNEVVDEINDQLLSMFPGDSKEYLSSYSICPDEHINDAIDPSLYSPDVLNGLKIPGLPHHKLALKVGVPVMLLRNINQKEGFCNGTRLKVV
ncbi:uncharacterized protein LOC143625788 [Bidens hawaiensis]|uniref:uncharacterized protein LOC143625788 n=1 Tax=Bidens hawaiensis TaxID=980011 RepID=UPI00404A0F3D